MDKVPKIEPDDVLVCNRCKLGLRVGERRVPSPCFTGEIPELAGAVAGHQFGICAEHCFHKINGWLTRRTEYLPLAEHPMLLDLGTGVCSVCPERNVCEGGYHSLPAPADYRAVVKEAAAAALVPPPPKPEPLIRPADDPDLDLLLPKMDESVADYSKRLAKQGTLVEPGAIAASVSIQRLDRFGHDSWKSHKDKRRDGVANGGEK